MGQIITLTLISGISLAIVHDLADDIIKNNESNRNRKSIVNAKSFSERLLLKGYRASNLKHKAMMNYCYVMNFLLLAILTIQVVVVPLCFVFTTIQKYEVIFLIVKSITLDCQIFIFALLNTKHQNNGGVSWRL